MYAAAQKKSKTIPSDDLQTVTGIYHVKDRFFSKFFLLCGKKM
jgi:hypothetical protein